MATMDITRFLDRTQTETQIKDLLNSFSTNVNDVNFKKGIYVYGSPGCGKTQFVMRILKELDYDVIKYDAGDVRNKTMIETITSNNVSNCNVLNMMKGKKQKIAIVMDEIDGMNSGDKGGITSLIKLIRQKKTKKQRLEHVTLNPIVCIGNYFVDKKIKELMKVCHTFELKSPTIPQIHAIMRELMPNIRDPALVKDILAYIQNDIRKLYVIHSLYVKSPEVITHDMIRNIFHAKSYNDDSKRIIHKLFESPVSIQEHNTFMNETDRTTVALLWHENVVDKLEKLPRKDAFPFYLKMLQNMCFADYIDRITFQNQIWVFNEMSSLIKTFHNNKLFHDKFRDSATTAKATTDVRFTKVLTKYSTEYNNLMFVYMLCQELDMDRADMIAFFQELRLFYGKEFFNKTDRLSDAEKIFADTDITKLDIKRVYRYLDKNVKRDVAGIPDEESDDEVEG